jgi:hypothetical protein
MDRLALITFLVSALPVVSTVYADDGVSDTSKDEITLMCRCRSYLKLRLRGPAAEAAVGLNLGVGAPRAYCPPPAYNPPQLYAPQEPPQMPQVTAPVYTPPPQVAPSLVCPEPDILTKLAVLHFLANNDARRDSRRDADQGDLAALQVLQNQRGIDRGRDDVNKEALAILQILQNQATQIGLSQQQTVLLQEIVAGMRQAVQLPGPGPSQLPAYPPPDRGSDRGPAPAPPPAPSYNRSSLPSSMGVQGRVFYRDTVFRK